MICLALSVVIFISLLVYAVHRQSKKNQLALENMREGLLEDMRKSHPWQAPEGAQSGQLVHQTQNMGLGIETKIDQNAEVMPMVITARISHQLPGWLRLEQDGIQLEVYVHDERFAHHDAQRWLQFPRMDWRTQYDAVSPGYHGHVVHFEQEEVIIEAVRPVRQITKHTRAYLHEVMLDMVASLTSLQQHLPDEACDFWVHLYQSHADMLSVRGEAMVRLLRDHGHEDIVQSLWADVMHAFDAPLIVRCLNLSDPEYTARCFARSWSDAQWIALWSAALAERTKAAYVLLKLNTIALDHVNWAVLEALDASHAHALDRILGHYWADAEQRDRILPFLSRWLTWMPIEHGAKWLAVWIRDRGLEAVPHERFVSMLRRQQEQGHWPQLTEALLRGLMAAPELEDSVWHDTLIQLVPDLPKTQHERFKDLIAHYADASLVRLLAAWVSEHGERHLVMQAVVGEGLAVAKQRLGQSQAGALSLTAEQGTHGGVSVVGEGGELSVHGEQGRET